MGCTVHPVFRAQQATQQPKVLIYKTWLHVDFGADVQCGATHSNGIGMNPAAISRLPSKTGGRSENCMRGLLVTFSMPASLVALSGHSIQDTTTVSPSPAPAAPAKPPYAAESSRACSAWYDDASGPDSSSQLSATRRAPHSITTLAEMRASSS